MKKIKFPLEHTIGPLYNNSLSSFWTVFPPLWTVPVDGINEHRTLGQPHRIERIVYWEKRIRVISKEYLKLVGVESLNSRHDEVIDAFIFTH